MLARAVDGTVEGFLRMGKVVVECSASQLWRTLASLLGRISIEIESFVKLIVREFIDSGPRPQTSISNECHGAPKIPSFMFDAHMTVECRYPRLIAKYAVVPVTRHWPKLAQLYVSIMCTVRFENEIVHR